MSPGSEPAGSGVGRPPAAAGGAVSATGWHRAAGPATTTLLVRHGQSPLSAQRRFAGRGDFPLTEHGREQAAAAAAGLAARGGIDLVVSSPLRRARWTAEAIAEAAGVPLTLDDDLAETDFGSWEGMSFGEVSARWPAEMAAWLADAAVAPPGGESFAAVAQRVLPALDRLLQAHPAKTLVVVSHVTPIKTIICRALLAPSGSLFRMNVDVASVSRIDWFEDGAAVLQSLNDTAHLRGNPVRGKPARGEREAV